MVVKAGREGRALSSRKREGHSWEGREGQNKQEISRPGYLISSHFSLQVEDLTRRKQSAYLSRIFHSQVVKVIKECKIEREKKAQIV